MKLTVYGGSFDPPHIGHVAAASAAGAQLRADKLLIMPDCQAPHKVMACNSASPQDRLELCRLSFGGIPGAEVSDLEICRGGKSYTSDTLHQLFEKYPGCKLFLLMGTDMLTSFERWHDFKWILGNVTLAVFPRQQEDGALIAGAAEALKERYGADIITVDMQATPVSSTDVRKLLPVRQGRQYLSPDAYAYVIKKRLYGAQPEFGWLREKAYAMLKPKRIEHVRGCEAEAVKLARRWGADEDLAAEAGILHDITKKLELDEQLILCRKYGIMTDKLESQSTKLLHSKTGAELARDMFGVCDAVYGAIRWHTTGRPNMTLLEKVIYMADYMEPSRSFDGVDKLRILAYEDLDRAMILAFEMSLEELKSYGETAHPNTLAALEWCKKEVGANEAQR